MTDNILDFLFEPKDVKKNIVKSLYSSQIVSNKTIEYNKFNNTTKTRELLVEALQDVDKIYGGKWELVGPRNNGEFNTLNNIICNIPEKGKKTTRTINNCYKVRFLYEWDNISLQQQEIITQKLITLGVLQRAVFSGSKSIHHIIELDSKQIPKTKEEYHFLHEYIANALELVGYDKQCKDNSRLTRAPGVLRKDKNKWQELIYYNNTNRFCSNDWYEYYLAEQKKDKTEKDVNRLYKNINKTKEIKSPIANMEFVNGYMKSEEKKGSFDDGKRHDNIPRIILGLKLNGGLTCEEIKDLLEPYLSDTSNNDLYNGIEKIYNYEIE